MSTAVAPNGSKQEKQQIAVKEKVDPIYGLRHAMNRIFDEFTFGWPIMPAVEHTFAWSPRVDVKETEKEVIVTAELPGVKNEDIDLQLYGDSLVLTGTKQEEKEEKKANYHRVERSYGSFQRTLPLPQGVDREQINATSDHGVLTVRMPKTKAAQEASKKIEIKTK